MANSDVVKLFVAKEPVLMNRSAIECFAANLDGDVYWDKPSGEMACTVKYIKNGTTVRLEFLAKENGLYELTSTCIV